MKRWASQLAPDLKRSALETYKHMRASGCLSVRDWIKEQYQGSKDSPVWTDLWSMAVSIDFSISEAMTRGGDMAVVHLLNSDDKIEVAMRRLASYVYVERTGDRTGGLRMLATPPPGARIDVAPSWLVEEATSHSKQEHQRGERVRASNRQGGWEPGGKKGKGKGAKGAKSD